jgi:hypothetical protein
LIEIKVIDEHQSDIGAVNKFSVPLASAEYVMMDGLIQIIKTSAWPIVVIIALIIFQAPLRRTLGELPDLLSHSESIKIANVEFRAKRLVLPPRDLRDMISSLSFSDIRFILDHQLSYPLQITRNDEALPSTEKAEWSRLSEMKLVTPLGKAKLDEINATYHTNSNWGLEVSDNIVRIREYLVSLTFELLNEITKQGKDSVNS